MKIRFGIRQSREGSILAMTLMTCVILGILMGSYLYLIQAQRQSVARSQSWNAAMVVAEAGVEEAMALLNSGIVGGNYAVYPWKSAGGGNYTNRISPMQFGDSYYAVTLSAPIGSNPVITSTGYVPGPVSTPRLSRTIRVQTKPRPTFPVKAPMIVEQSFNSNGNNVGTDSFDSSLGAYNPSTAGTNGDVVTLSTNANSIVIGNGNLKGSVRTPPGGVQGITATIGSNGSVGDADWVNGGNFGFETGHFRDDFTLADFPDAVVPNATAWYSPLGGVAPDGLYYNYLLTGLTTYQISDLTGSVYVGSSNTILYVTGSISISGNAKKKTDAPPEIYIAPGASLTLYMGGATASIAGNGIANATGQARNFAYYGLPSNTSLTISGNAAFYGSIYAPNADFKLGGSGNTTTNDFTGASITKTTTMTGRFNFHYDADLSTLTTLGGFDAYSWSEL
jgi:hypothetical protein